MAEPEPEEGELERQEIRRIRALPENQQQEEFLAGIVDAGQVNVASGPLPNPNRPLYTRAPQPEADLRRNDALARADRALGSWHRGAQYPDHLDQMTIDTIMDKVDKTHLDAKRTAYQESIRNEQGLAIAKAFGERAPRLIDAVESIRRHLPLVNLDPTIFPQLERLDRERAREPYFRTNYEREFARDFPNIHPSWNARITDAREPEPEREYDTEEEEFLAGIEDP